MPGAAVYLYANGQMVVRRPALPEGMGDHREELADHLGAENWKRWETLASDENAQLDAVVALWNEIGDRMAAAARRAGFFPSSQPMSDMPDTYWPELFIASILREPESFAAKKVHSWDSVKIVEENIQLPMSTLRHSPESIHVWVFESSDMIRSQSPEALRAFMRAWEEEALRVGPRIMELSTERARIEMSAREFRSLLHGLETEYERTMRLPGVCPICMPQPDGPDSAQTRGIPDG
jgi:hypothetical protein